MWSTPCQQRHTRHKLSDQRFPEGTADDEHAQKQKIQCMWKLGRAISADVLRRPAPAVWGNGSVGFCGLEPGDL
jgi:hypothetical protein